MTYGAADLGIVGQDILLEQQPDVYEPLDLGFGFCRLVVAERRELFERDIRAKWSWVRVATKYPRLTEQYFSSRGIQVEIVRLDGSVELAPLVGLADRIVDLVQSGETLRANGLVEVAEITRSTARLIVNRASMKTEYAAVMRLHRRDAVAADAPGGGRPMTRRAHPNAGRADASGSAAVVSELERPPPRSIPASCRRSRRSWRAVRERGDEALLELTARSTASWRVTARTRHRAGRFRTRRSALPPAARERSRYAAERIERYHAAAVPKSWRITDEHGSILGQDMRPLDRVGVYIPGGRAAYPSTVLMTAIPARVAGVREIVLVTPPDADGRVEPAVLAAARMAGVTEG